MNWNQVGILFRKELRDQIRDRRTLLTMAILPLLLYPLMGMLMLQISQVRRPQQVVIGLIDVDQTNSRVPSLSSIADALPDTDGRGNEVSWRTVEPDELPGTARDLAIDGGRKIESNEAIAALARARVHALLLRDASRQPGHWTLIVDQADEASILASNIAMEFARDQHQRHLTQHLKDSGIAAGWLEPPQIRTVDVAVGQQRSSLLWAKLLPLVMFVWALTGAFYPAIDLCAGEKERGTLETLLVSPATRREIVLGKLATVIVFSVATAMLNLLSMQTTVSLVGGQFAGADPSLAIHFEALPLTSLPWLLVMLLPISLLFSSLAMAVATLARSSKEAQYYLMPMILVGMPLVLLPMMPGIKLSLGTAMIPVSGAVLLSRSLIESQWSEALLFAPLVIAVTAGCCCLTVRWAVRQFEVDSILLGGGDALQLKLWLHRMWMQRHAAASPGAALSCGLIILLALFYGRLSAGGMPSSWESLVSMTVISQLAMVLAPCLIMAAFLTSRPAAALRMHRVKISDVTLAAFLAICLHPTYLLLAQWIQSEFPMAAEMKGALAGVDTLVASAPLWAMLLAFAFVPAVCEEFAFRGFIFAGLMQNRGYVRAIALTSILFGLSHGLLQQSITAAAMGVVLGLIAWQTGSVWCTIVLHATHNGLSMLLVRAAKSETLPHSLQPFMVSGADGWSYSPAWHAVSLLLATVLLLWYCRGLLRPQSVQHIAPLATEV